MNKSLTIEQTQITKSILGFDAPVNILNQLKINEKLKTLFWDLDDTLTQTQLYYNKANDASAQLVFELLGGLISLEEVKSTMRQVDKDNIKIYGYSRKRMPNSWKDTYTVLANKYGIATTSENIEKVYDSGEEIFRMNIPLYEDSIPTLQIVKDMGYEMRILTLGEVAIQEKRIKDTNIASYFNDIHIVSEKTTEMYRKIVGVDNLHSSVMIGNSLRSDIEPALDNNMFALHVNRESWVHDQIEVDTNHPKYRFIEQLPDLTKVLTTL